MVFSKKFYTGSLGGYKAVKRGYYNVSGFFRAREGRTSQTAEMAAYTLPTITYSGSNNRSILTITQGILPDYSILPAQVCLLAKKGFTYLAFRGNGIVEVFDNAILDGIDDDRRLITYNFFIKNGKPLLSLANEVADAMYCGKCKVSSHTPRVVYRINCNVRVAQFGGNNVNAACLTSGYIDSLYTFPDQNTREYECDVILKVKTGTGLTGVQKVLGFGGFWFGINEGNFAFAALNSVVNGVAATANKSYWLRVMQTGFDVMSYTLLYLEDDGTYTMDTLPGVGQWQIAAYGQFTSCAAHNSVLRLSDMTNSWSGTYDLLNCRASIKYHDALSWEEVWHAADVIN